jgi:hypothetical protein
MIDGYTALYKAEKRPLYCQKCGSKLTESKRLDGYNVYTGDGIWVTWLLCPLKMENSKHSAWKDMEVEKYTDDYL